MCYFEPEPDIVLNTAEDLRNALANEDQLFADLPKVKYFSKTGASMRNDFYAKRIKSAWLVELIREIAAKQYPYNSTIQREAEKRLEIEKQSDEGSFLGWLVYRAQSYRRTEEYIAGGFSPLTQEMIEQAFKLGGKIETHSEPLFEIVVNGVKQEHKNTRYVPREHKGKIYAFAPRSRTKVVSVNGQPAKIVF